MFLVGQHGFGQDIHWSQFNDNPIFQNPGNAGHFNGDIRFVGNFRDQWRSVTVPFSTLSTSVDANFGRYENFGGGLLIFHDVVGDGQFRTVEVQGNLSCLIKLTADSTHSIRPGINLGMNHRQFNSDQFYFDSQFDGVQFNPSLPTNEVFAADQRTNMSVGLGAVYEYFRDPHFKFQGGISVFNLNTPDQGFFGTSIRRDIRFNIFGKGLVGLIPDWDLVPELQLGFQGIYREIVLGSRVKYTLTDRLGVYRALYAGLFYRNRDAAYLSVGMDYQNWFAGISYDLNFSKLVPASNMRGGFEIAVRYIINRFKPKTIVHRICPDYI